VIQAQENGRVQLGSVVVLEGEGGPRTFQIVGPQETNPMRGRISHLSPLGASLMGKREGELLEVEMGKKKMTFLVKGIQNT